MYSSFSSGSLRRWFCFSTRLYQIRWLADKRMAFQDSRILLIALERTHHLVGQRESKNADSVSALATDMSSAICFSFCFLFADSLNMFAKSLTRDKQLRTTGHFLSPYNHFMILPSEMLVEHAPDSAPRAKKLVEHWLRRRHGSRAPGQSPAVICQTHRTHYACVRRRLSHRR